MPINHASFHENNGIDRIDVTGLPGVLGSAQTAKVHAPTHKVGGSDTLDALALPNATNFELVARKGAANGYSGLDTDQQVPRPNLARVPEDPDPFIAARYDGDWGPVLPIAHASSHESGGDDEVTCKAETLNETGAFVNVAWNAAETAIASITVPASYMNSSLGIVMNLAGRLTTAVDPGALLRIKVKKDALVLCQHDVDVNKASDAPASIHGLIAAIDTLNLKAYQEFFADTDAVQHLGIHVATCAAGIGYTADETVFSITAQFIDAGITHQFLVDVSHSWNTGQQT